MDNVRELMHQRAEIVSRARAMIDEAEKENRGLTVEEEKVYAGLVFQADGLSERIERLATQADLERRANSAQPDPVIGMGANEVRRYSIVRAIRAMANKDWRGAELEREASEATAKALGMQPQGFFVPADVMGGRALARVRTPQGYQYAPVDLRADLSKGSASAGGYTVATDLLAESFIEMLRNQMMVQRAGATILGDLVGDVAIPKATGGATAYWVAESGAPTESQQTFGQLALSPKTVGAFTDISRKLLKQSSIDVENFVRGDLTAILALAIDKAALHGSGASNEPTGIANTAGIGSVAGGTNGLAPTWAHIVSLETEVAIDNADLGRLAYMTNAKVRGKAKQTAKVSSTDSVMLWADNASPLNGYPTFVTNQVRSDMDKGTSTGVCSGIFFGNWADLVIAMWGTLDILVDPYTGGTAGTVRVIALEDVDIGLRHVESFAAMLDALTA